MRKTGISIILLFIINVIIFLNRHKGFEYVNALSREQLYPAECDNACINKWTKPGKIYSSSELAQGLSFLQKKIFIDTIKIAENKIVSVAAYLFDTYQHQIGFPSSHLNSLKPLQQIQLLSSDTSQHLWCGNFQSIFGYFTTAMGLPNRYIELTSFPGSEQGGTHEVNEVYLEEYKKWVMVDATRNMLLIKKEDVPVSAADYFNFNLYNQPGVLQVLKAATDNSFIFDTLTAGKKPQDYFFNKNFFLRYYYMTDLQKVYSPLLKLKRYMLPDPWYSIYDPQNSYSDFRFRVKQLFIFLLGISLLLYLFLFLKKNKPFKSD